MNNHLITFNDNAKQEFLDLLDKSIDSEGYLIEKTSPSQRVLSPEGEQIKLEDFAGVRKGSEIFIKSDFASLIDVSDLIQ